VNENCFCYREFVATNFVVSQSQRDCIIQPKVVPRLRDYLGCEKKNEPTPSGLHRRSPRI
jgi:hypothetical protein